MKQLHTVEIPVGSHGVVKYCKVKFYGSTTECFETHYGFEYRVPVSEKVAKRLLNMAPETPLIYVDKANDHWYVRIEFVPYEEYGI